MNIQESNKLIADFMGVHITHPALRRNVMQKSHYVDELKYNESWDWLMPVIEKISLDIFEENKDGEFDHCYPRTFGMMNKEKEYMFRFNRYGLHSDAKLINAAYCAVVEYIQALNS